MSCKNCKKNRKRALKEQYLNDKVPGGLGGTNTSSSGQYTSAGAWDQKGPFFKTQRKTPKSEVKEVDITDGNQEYKGYNKGLSIDQIPTDNQSPTPNIETIEDAGPQYAIVNTQDNGYRDPYDNDNPDPYDRQRPDPKKTRPEKEWRSPPCCRPCGGGKWKRDCGELERAPGSKKSNSTGCVYKSYSDCQLAGKSLSEQTSADNSGQYTSPAAWEQGGILTTNTGTALAGSETLGGAPEIGITDDFNDVDVTILSLDDLDGMPIGLEDLLGDVVSNDEVSIETQIPLEFDPEDELTPEDELISEGRKMKKLYKTTPVKKRTLTESVKNIRKMIKRMS